MFNIQGMSPAATSKSRWKIPYLQDRYIINCEEDIPFIALTETWLKPHITDAQIALPNYSVVRSDRKKSERGGTLIYIRDDIPVTSVEKYDDDICQAVICTLESSNAIIASIYNPPCAPSNSFKSCMQCIQNYINTKTASKHYDISISPPYHGKL